MKLDIIQLLKVRKGLEEKILVRSACILSFGFVLVIIWENEFLNRQIQIFFSAISNVVHILSTLLIFPSQRNNLLSLICLYFKIGL